MPLELTPVQAQVPQPVKHNSPTAEGGKSATLGALRTPDDFENLSKTFGIDPRRASDRWIFGRDRAFEPTPAVGDHPGVLQV